MPLPLTRHQVWVEELEGESPRVRGKGVDPLVGKVALDLVGALGRHGRLSRGIWPFPSTIHPRNCEGCPSM